MLKQFIRTIVVGALLVPFLSYAQEIKKKKFEADGKSYSYYETKYSSTVQGILILLPAAGENPKTISKKTNLPECLASIGYVTITPEIPSQMFADASCINELNKLIELKVTQYQLQKDNVVLGGLSDGGAIALSYTEYLSSRPVPIRIKATFAIDPPADLARIYQSAEKEMNYKCPLIQKEGKSVKDYLDKILGGSPDTHSANYYKNAVFSAAQADGGNARFLKGAVVRLYSEPDLAFVQHAYCPELQYFNLNAFDLEKLTKLLKGMGDETIEYITTNNRGFHSWNIVDAIDFRKWISTH